MDQTKSWFFKKINKLKHSAPQRKKKGRKHKLHVRKTDIIIDPLDIRRIIGKHYKQL